MDVFVCACVSVCVRVRAARGCVRECACVRVSLNRCVCLCARGCARVRARLCGSVHADVWGSCLFFVRVCARICVRAQVRVCARVRARASVHACARVRVRV